MSDPQYPLAMLMKVRLEMVMVPASSYVCPQYPVAMLMKVRLEMVMVPASSYV